METLFSTNMVVGTFKGFTDGGMEFHADLVLPYQSSFNNIPMYGQFLLIQLETPEEAVLGRIASISSDGKLSSGAGEDYNIRSVRDGRPIPEDLREQYLKYRVSIRVLGGLRLRGSQVVFVPSHRRIPHVGSPVAFPSDEILKFLAGGSENGAEIGVFALGEFIYTGGDARVLLEPLDWMRICSPKIPVRFPVNDLVARRSFVFARAGFGKSNLNKLLFSELYKETPTVKKKNDRAVPVGTVIFDRDGEYFWPDDKGRPGLCDVTALNDQIIVFTSREAPSGYYRSFVASGIKLDIRRFRPTDIISIALSKDKQDQQNVRKLKGLNSSKWEELVNLIYAHKNEADKETISRILNLENSQEAEAFAARANMTVIIRALHDPGSQFFEMLKLALSEGKLCIVDVSQLSGEQALILSGIILKQIFDHNQIEFTKADSKTIPTIAVIEEAQSVLLPNVPAAEPYISWVKEGRKYDLGALMITQQPGSIPNDILSQGDNWFIFHLLSAQDLQNVKGANAHFSGDILSSLLNEPIPGQGAFWSSVSGKPYPVPLRVLSFEQMVQTQDPDYCKGECDLYASRLKNRFHGYLSESSHIVNTDLGDSDNGHEEVAENTSQIDALETIRRQAFEKAKVDPRNTITDQANGIAYGRIQYILIEHLPDGYNNKEFAYSNTLHFLDYAYPGQWELFTREDNKKAVRLKNVDSHEQ